MRRALVLLVLLSGCGGGGGGGTPSTAAKAVLKVIGPSGGTISTTDGRMSLEVPAGALASDTEISLRPITKADLGSAFADAQVEGAWEMGPDGLQFAEPVTVTRLLDQTPQKADGSLKAAIVGLVSVSGAKYSLAEGQRLDHDAASGKLALSATIRHFSNLVTIDTGLVFEVDDVPDSILHDGLFSVVMKLTMPKNLSTAESVQFDSLASVSPLEIPSPDPTSYPLKNGETVRAEEGPYGCSSVGDGVFRATAEVQGLFFTGTLGVVAEGGASTMDLPISLEKPVTCTAEPPAARAYQLTIEGIEAAAKAFGFPWPDDQNPPRRLVVVAGKDEVAFVDTDTGDEVEKLPTPAGDNYGTVPLTDGDVPYLFAFGSYGAVLFAHRTDKSLPAFGDGAFGDPVVVSTDNITDATPTSNGGLLFVDNTTGRILFLDPDGPGYSVAATAIALADVISAAETSDGSFLAITGGSDQELYSIADRTASPVKIDYAGSVPRRVRTLGDLAFVSAYGNGISFGGVSSFHRSGGTWKIGAGIAAINAVGIDLLPLASGNIVVAAPDYGSNSFRLIVFDPDDQIVSADSFDLPPGSTAPGHALWLPGAPGYADLAITCHLSNGLDIIPFSTSE